MSIMTIALWSLIPRPVVHGRFSLSITMRSRNFLHCVGSWDICSILESFRNSRNRSHWFLGAGGMNFSLFQSIPGRLKSPPFLMKESYDIPSTLLMWSKIGTCWYYLMEASRMSLYTPCVGFSFSPVSSLPHIQTLVALPQYQVLCVVLWIPLLWDPMGTIPLWSKHVVVNWVIFCYICSIKALETKNSQFSGNVRKWLLFSNRDLIMYNLIADQSLFRQRSGNYWRELYIHSVLTI